MLKEPVVRESGDVLARRLAALRELIPEGFTEDKIDFDHLRAALGDDIATTAERYSFTWAGKRDAIRVLQTPSRATLEPRPGESLNFEDTENLFIEGDNLEVLKLLYKSYCGRVKLVYIDPPYNTGNDFVYPDNYADPLDTYLRLTGQKSAEGNLLTSNPETSGRYHSAWLSMMYPRLFLARQLLRDDGVIFVSIDDNEVHNLRLAMNEIFGEENFVTQIEWQKRYTRSNNTDNFTSVIDHILVYSRSQGFRPNLFERDEEANKRYANPDHDPRGPWKATPFLNQVPPAKRPNLCYEVTNPNTGERTSPDKKAWRYERSVYERLLGDNRLWWGSDGKSRVPDIKTYLSEVRQGMTPINLWDYDFAGHTDAANAEIKELFGEKIFDTPKPTRLIRRMLEIGTSPETDDIVLDFFAGSCATAHAVLLQNREDGGSRRFIVVQIPEPTELANFSTIDAIGKERIRRAAAQLAQSGEQLKLDATHAKPDLGFRVFSLRASNIKPWRGIDDSSADSYSTELALFADPLMPGWTPDGVIWEVALKEGFDLSSRVSHCKSSDCASLVEITDRDSSQRLLISLDDSLTKAKLDSIDLGRYDLFVCRDAALDDTLAANLALQCRVKCI